jgi:hypothetical protein
MRQTMVKAWAGFSEGKLHFVYPVDEQYADGGTIVPAIFRTREAACLRYEDVRRVEIKVIE